MQREGRRREETDGVVKSNLSTSPQWADTGYGPLS